MSELIASGGNTHYMSFVIICRA